MQKGLNLCASLMCKIVYVQNYFNDNLFPIIKLCLKAFQKIFVVILFSDGDLGAIGLWFGNYEMGGFL